MLIAIIQNTYVLDTGLNKVKFTDIALNYAYFHFYEGHYFSFVCFAINLHMKTVSLVRRVGRWTIEYTGKEDNGYIRLNTLRYFCGDREFDKVNWQKEGF